MVTKIGEVLANVEIFGTPVAPNMPPQTTAVLEIRQDLASGALSLPVFKGDKGDKGDPAPAASISGASDIGARQPGLGDMLRYQGGKWHPWSPTYVRVPGSGFTPRSGITDRLYQILRTDIRNPVVSSRLYAQGVVNVTAPANVAINVGLFTTAGSVSQDNCVAIGTQPAGGSGVIALMTFGVPKTINPGETHSLYLTAWRAGSGSEPFAISRDWSYLEIKAE